MSVRIKICGLRRVQDIQAVNRYKPDYAGFILTGGFRRSIDADTFFELKSILDDDIKAVGVFVDEPLERIEETFAEGLDTIQLHGNEDEDYIKTLKGFFKGDVWKAVRAKAPEDIEKADRLDCDVLVIDSFVKGVVGGTGKEADTGVILKADITKPFFIAGGVGEENALRLIDTLAPFGADISSSVETQGFKDEEKIKQIISIIRSYQYGKDRTLR